MRLFCCLCLIWNLSLAYTSEPLDFSQLEEFMLGNNMALAEMQGKRVTIRGFLYDKKPPHESILAATPNLKSCCVGHLHKQPRQMIVLGNLDASNHVHTAVNLEGVFHIDSLYNPQGQWSPSYHLEEALLIQENHGNFLWVAIGYGMLVIGIFFLIRRFKTA